MEIRKCAFTGLESDAKDHIAKKDEETKHNWSNEVPACKKYKEFKNGQAKTMLEIEACRVFLELEKIDVIVRALKIRQAEIQYILKEQMDAHYEAIRIEKEKEASQTVSEVQEIQAELEAKLLESLNNTDFWNN